MVQVACLGRLLFFLYFWEIAFLCPCCTPPTCHPGKALGWVLMGSAHFCGHPSVCPSIYPFVHPSLSHHPVILPPFIDASSLLSHPPLLPLSLLPFHPSFFPSLLLLPPLFCSSILLSFHPSFHSFSIFPLFLSPFVLSIHPPSFYASSTLLCQALC